MINHFHRARKVFSEFSVSQIWSIFVGILVSYLPFTCRERLAINEISISIDSSKFSVLEYFLLVDTNRYSRSAILKRSKVEAVEDLLGLRCSRKFFVTRDLLSNDAVYAQRMQEFGHLAWREMTNKISASKVRYAAWYAVEGHHKPPQPQVFNDFVAIGNNSFYISGFDKKYLFTAGQYGCAVLLFFADNYWCGVHMSTATSIEHGLLYRLKNILTKKEKINSVRIVSFKPEYYVDILRKYFPYLGLSSYIKIKKPKSECYDVLVNLKDDFILAQTCMYSDSYSIEEDARAYRCIYVKQ